MGSSEACGFTFVLSLPLFPTYFEFCTCKYRETRSSITRSTKMIIEIATVQLKVEEDPSNQNSPVSKEIQEVTAPNLRKNGARYVYYGLFIGKPNTVIVFVDWDSLDDHKLFMSSPVSETLLLLRSSALTSRKEQYDRFSCFTVGQWTAFKTIVISLIEGTLDGIFLFPHPADEKHKAVMKSTLAISSISPINQPP